MDVLQLQVRRAHRRLVLQQFLSIATWSLFVTLLVAAIGISIPKIWVLAVDSQVWMWSWIGGSLGAGLLTAVVWTYIVRRSQLEAAIEIDRRFGLKERVSSTLSLAAEERDSEVGQALVTDAVRRVERVDIREQFRVSPNWRNALPLIPAMAVVLLALLPNAVMKKGEAATELSEQAKKNVKTKLQQVLQKQQQQQEQKKKDNAEVQDGQFEKEFAKKLNDLMSKENIERKEAIIKINELSKDIEKKKRELGGAEEMKKELGKLKDLEKGPADKFAEAMKEGDLGKAQEELKKLMDGIKKGELGDKEKEQLAKQLEKMKEKIQEKQQQRAEAKKKLEEQIKQKMDAGDQAGAEKLQQKLDEMKQKEDDAQQKMEQMAQKLGECAQCMKQGGQEGQQQAGQKLDQLAKDLQKLQKELEEIKDLDDLLDQLADAKGEMQEGEDGKTGDGEMAEGDGDNKGKDGDDKGEPGKGKNNKGRGQGERDEEENKTSFYDSQVKTTPQKGNSVRIGDAGGKNIAGQTKQSIKEAVRAEKGSDPDAQDERALPRDQKEHSNQYFKKFRDGEFGKFGELEEAKPETK